MTVIIILAALLALTWYLSKKFVAPKQSNEELFKISEDDIINDIPTISNVEKAPKMKATPKKKKETKSEFPISAHAETVKPKRKYNKKPKA
jgi:hypothetical protein